MPVVRRVIHNPADPTQGYKLWSSGLIQPIGAAPPTDFDPPDTWADLTAQDFAVIDWLTPSGYVLSWAGTVWAFGGATPALNFQDTGAFHIWRRLVMNPVGNGQGYEMDFRGRIWRFGPTLPPNVGGPAGSNADGLAGGIDWGGDEARDLYMDYASKRWAILRRTGQVETNFGTITLDVDDPRPLYVGRDVYRGIAFVNPAIPPGDTAGYLCTYSGRTFGINGAEHVSPSIPYPDRDVIVGLDVVSDGRAGRPLVLELEHRDGPRPQITYSSPPTAAALTWDSPITTTTRPAFTWDYSDPNGDAQAKAVVRLFRSTQYVPSGFSPGVTEPLAEWVVTDARTFQVAPDFDLPNGTYRYYVQATDTAGDVSVWSWAQFTLNVTPPPAPVISSTVEVADAWAVDVTVTAGSGTAGGLSAVLEYSDDPDADPTQDPDDRDGTWLQVVGGLVAYPTTGSKVVTIRDWQVGFNRSRKYRARTVQIDPAITSASSAADTATLATDEWVLSNPATGDAFEVIVEPPFTYARDSGGAAHRALGRRTAIVTRLGMQSADFDLTLRAPNRDAFDEVERVLAAETTLHLRDPYQRSIYFGITGSIGTEMMEVAPDQLIETTEFAFAHRYTWSCAEEDRPSP